MYTLSTNSKDQANKVLSKIEDKIIDLKLQKAKIESDIYYYTLLEKDLPLSKSDKAIISNDKKNLSMLRQVIDFFSNKLDTMVSDNTQEYEKKTIKSTKSTASSRRA
jgi:hypothetical protein